MLDKYLNNGNVERAIAIGLPIAILTGFLMPEIALASVESSLSAIQTKLTTGILPVAAMIGLGLAAFSFFTGSPNARTHVVLAIIGCIIGFGAPSIVEFIRALIH